ncbi:MAG TPA: pentapeptide repeat-containing protein, partial [Methanothrix sp.]|nr:pentapeptide repeat-containing protein [Methanothrix sp.]
QNNPIRITNSVFQGDVICEGVTFQEEVDFENTTFMGDAVFNETKFMAAGNFNASRFLGEASFNMSRFPDGGNFDFAGFSGRADFANIWFDKFATFYDAGFEGDMIFPFSEFNGAYVNFESVLCLENVDFAGSQFNSYSTFAASRMEKNADFHAAKFQSGADFSDMQFIGQADFSRSHFIEDCIFSESQFGGYVGFPNAKFDGPAFMNDTVFGGVADFDNAQFLALTDMSNAAFSGDLKMNSTKVSKMVLDGSKFEDRSRLYLARADISRMMVDWDKIRDIISFDKSAYLSLIKNYRELGQTNDANDCYYEYRYLNQVNKPAGFSRFLDTVAWLTCGYGVRPHYALLCGMMVILIFAFIYWAGRGVEGFNDIHGRRLAIASLFYSIIAFTANSKGLPFRGRFRYLGISEGIVGWLLMALFLVTLGRVMIG